MTTFSSDSVFYGSGACVITDPAASDRIKRMKILSDTIQATLGASDDAFNDFGIIAPIDSECKGWKSKQDRVSELFDLFIKEFTEPLPTVSYEQTI